MITNKITQEQFKKAFNLSNSCGPCNNGVVVVKTISRAEGGFFIVLKSTKMVMYPVKSYGTKKASYAVYSSVFDQFTNDLVVAYNSRYSSLKKCNESLKIMK